MSKPNQALTLPRHLEAITPASGSAALSQRCPGRVANAVEIAHLRQGSASKLADAVSDLIDVQCFLAIAGPDASSKLLLLEES